MYKVSLAFEVMFTLKIVHIQNCYSLGVWFSIVIKLTLAPHSWAIVTSVCLSVSWRYTLNCSNSTTKVSTAIKLDGEMAKVKYQQVVLHKRLSREDTAWKARNTFQEKHRQDWTSVCSNKVAWIQNAIIYNFIWQVWLKCLVLKLYQILFTFEAFFANSCSGK